jgi:prepilin-type processing-associated H-X9-DG protein
MMKCPSFGLPNLHRAADQADCDGNGTPGSGSTNFRNPQAILAHYGMSFSFSNPTGGATQANPYFNWPGSGWNSATEPAIMPLAGIARPAETANIGDGVTLVRSAAVGTRINAQFGCEAAFAHSAGGGNFAFLDGHAKFLKGNIERYLKQDANNRWYQLYLSVDRE